MLERPVRQIARVSPPWLFVPALFAAGLLLVQRSRASQPVAEDPTSVLGRPIPEVHLTTLDGQSVSLRDKLNGRAALIIVMGPRDCTSCANLPLELRIVRSKFPHLGTVVVGSGDAVDAFRVYFGASHLEGYGLIDKERALLRSLELEREPITMLVDTSGRILFIDARSPSEASHYPIGRLLLELISTLIRD